jgi:hypothetical protein
MVHELCALLSAPTYAALKDAELDRVVGCRDSLLHSLRRQLELAAAVGDPTRPSLAAIAAEPVRPLRSALATLPVLGRRAAPTDVLIGHADDAVMEGWRQVARAVLLATDVLDSTQTWRTTSEAQWEVVADAAAAVLAVCILDGDLANTATHTDRDLAKQLRQTNQRGLELGAALVLQVAHSGPMSRSAIGGLARPVPTDVRPRAVCGLSEAAAGQHRLATMLRLRKGVLPLSALGHVLVGQARVAHAVAEIAGNDGHGSGEALVTAMRARAHALTRLARSRARVADLLPADPAVVLQTGEVLRAVEHHTLSRPARDGTDQTSDLAAPIARESDRVFRLLVNGITHSFVVGHYLVPTPHSTALTWQRPLSGDPPSLLLAAEEAAQAPALPLPPAHSPLKPNQDGPLTDAIARRLAGRRPVRPLHPGMPSDQPLIR